jgi:type III restriction enzyme
MSDMIYDPALVDTVATTLDLRRPNRDALDVLAQALDGADHGKLLVADLATGVGKTYIAAGLLDYLYGLGVRNVVIVTPGSTIQRKTVANLTPGQPKYVRGLQCRPTVITLDNFEKGEVAQAMANPDEMKVFVFTVQSLLRPDTKENRRAHREHETIGQSLSDYLRAADDLVIIADEHHIYAGKAKRFAAAISDLDPVALVGLTATPDPSTPAESIVYHYPLADAIADGYVKIPVLVGRPDAVKDTRTQLADAVALLDAKVTALTAWCEQTGHVSMTPVLFVVAQTIDEANEIKETLAQPDLLGSADKVLLITSEEPDTVLVQLDALEDPASPFRAVVSVSMLKEGWDVKNIYVIASVRAMESELLSEQVLGRGLRLPFGRRTGVGMLDTVEVLSHHSFRKLLEEAEVLLSQTLGERTDEAESVAIAAGDTIAEGSSIGELADTDLTSDHTQVGIFLPGTPSNPNQGALFPADETPQQVGGISTLAARLGEATSTTEALRHPETPRSITGVTLPLFIPSVTTRWMRDRFSLTSINTVEVEALGRNFGKDNAPSLTRKALNAERTETGTVEVHITDASDEAPTAAFALRLPFETIETDLTRRLLSSNAIEQTISEANAATALSRSFLTGAGVDPDTQWRPEHARLASGALVQWLAAKQSEAPARQSTEVLLNRWPVGAGERMLSAKPQNRNKVTSRKQFVRSFPYSGWAKSIYESASFDSWSAEFLLATLMDSSPAIVGWTRITTDVPLAIAYSTGATTRSYIPDFVVIDTEGTHWVVEAKADSEMSDVIVLAKRDAAVAWVNVVNASGTCPDKWGYVLTAESAIGNAPDWASLLAASFTHR